MTLAHDPLATERPDSVALNTVLQPAASRLRAERPNAVFMRAGRIGDGQSSYRLERGHSLPTSFGVDLFDRTFGTHLAQDMATTDGPA